MFKIAQSTFTNHPYLSKSASEDLLLKGSLKYFDREGYELAELEESLYRDSDIPLSRILNHTSAGAAWIEQTRDSTIKLDHSALFTRYSYSDTLGEQIAALKTKRHELNKLLAIKPKFGIDVSIDLIDENSFIELFHVEKDFLSRDRALEEKSKIEQIVQNTDWNHFAQYLLSKRDEWINLCSDDESDYKVRLLGVNRAFDNIKVYHGG